MGRRAVALPRRRLRLVRARARRRRAAARDPQGRRLAGHVQGLRLRAAGPRGCSRSSRPRPRCSGRPATPMSAGFGIDGHHAIPERELTDGDPRGRRARRPRRRRDRAGRARGRQVPGPGAAPARPRRARRRPPDRRSPASSPSARPGGRVEADDSTLDHLLAAAGWRIGRRPTPPPSSSRAGRAAARARRPRPAPGPSRPASRPARPSPCTASRWRRPASCRRSCGRRGRRGSPRAPSWRT